MAKKKKTKKTKVENSVKILAVFLIVFLNLFIFTAVFRSYFVSAASINTVLTEAKAYNTATEIAKEKIQEVMPESVKDDPIAYAAINYGINRFLTPDLVARIFEPILNAMVKVASSPNTSIEGNNVVLDTTDYKTNLTTNIANYELPKGIESAATQLVSSIPTELKIIDLEKRPNSIIGRLVAFKEKLYRLNNILWVLGLGTLGFVIALYYQKREKINTAIRVIAVTLAASGVTTMIVGGLVSLFIKSFPPYSTQTIIDSLVNTLITDLINYYMKGAASWGFWIAILSGVVYIFTLEKVQKSISDTYNKLKTKIA